MAFQAVKTSLGLINCCGMPLAAPDWVNAARGFCGNGFFATVPVFTAVKEQHCAAH